MLFVQIGILNNFIFPTSSLRHVCLPFVMQNKSLLHPTILSLSPVKSFQRRETILYFILHDVASAFSSEHQLDVRYIVVYVYWYMIRFHILATARPGARDGPRMALLRRLKFLLLKYRHSIKIYKS